MEFNINLDSILENFNSNKNQILKKGNFREFKRDFILKTQESLDKWETSNKFRDDQKTLFQVMDFFCGAGGMSLGFAALANIMPSFEMIGGCDIDPDAVKTYELNFHAPGIMTDIRTLVDDNRNDFDEFLKKFPKYDNKKPLILIGCAPCQGFTSHRKKNWNIEDNRNTLVGAFADIAVKLQPVCIVMENVPEMLSKKYWDHFEAARKTFEKAGYIVHQTIYNAASFGVPQERFRSLVIAMKKDFLLPDVLLTEPDQYITVKQTIGNLPKVAPGKQCLTDRYHISANHRESTIQTIKAVPKDGGNRPIGVGPKCLDKIKGFSDVYGRLYWNRPSITITHYARNPASGRFVHPEQDRGLTIRETALLQSFPKGFIFKGSFDSIFKQIGEAVPPKMACAVAANVFIELLSLPPNETEKKNAVISINQPVSNSYSSVIAGIKLGRDKK
jgi:DNA (cytosine-5)-methyltransferase 1